MYRLYALGVRGAGRGESVREEGGRTARVPWRTFCLDRGLWDGGLRGAGTARAGLCGRMRSAFRGAGSAESHRPVAVLTILSGFGDARGSV